ncbi:hypothetical protein OEG86_09835 [Hoeflea alexandrii]|uniref:hypothetical protein n=1 Tax=Hoeflea alexandrii TaxID=288436 RepID=UPI0022709870|nr:hypothetical protein [Hoeflea alexandrii]MCY0152479.1 hypothetical protein [Hoeflea alexandrii]
MPDPVYILGGAQTDFARNWHREGLGIDAMMAETLMEGLEATSLEARDIQSVHVTNFTAELFCNQGQLGGMVASMHPDLSGVPTSRHEAACASGSMGILAMRRRNRGGALRSGLRSGRRVHAQCARSAGRRVSGCCGMGLAGNGPTQSMSGQRHSPT